MIRKMDTNVWSLRAKSCKFKVITGSCVMTINSTSCLLEDTKINPFCPLFIQSKPHLFYSNTYICCYDFSQGFLDLWSVLNAIFHISYLSEFFLWHFRRQNNSNDNFLQIAGFCPGSGRGFSRWNPNCPIKKFIDLLILFLSLPRQKSPFCPNFNPQE